MSAASPYEYDVFLSHSSKDKAVVRALAERLRADGLRVWFDQSELKSGDYLPTKLEEALDRSRVLVLCMSANSLGSDWTQLEAGTFLFRDPTNKERRFIPIRLDDAPVKASLAPFLHIDWTPAQRKAEYPKLFEACRPPTEVPRLETQAAQERSNRSIASLGHTNWVRSVAFSPDNLRVVSGSADKTVRVWEVESGRCLRVLEGHADSVLSVTWSSDGRRLLSGSADKTVRVWAVNSGNCLRVLEGHAGCVSSVAWTSDGRRLLSGSREDKNTVRVWEGKSGRCLRVLKGHANSVYSVAWSNDDLRVLSGSADKTVRVWDVESGCCLQVMKGHADGVLSVAWSRDGRRVLSGSRDKIVRVWDVETGRCLRVLEGHASSVYSVVWSSDGRRVFSGSDDNTVRLWEVSSGSCLRVLEGHTSCVLSVALSSDGGSLLSGSEDKTVRLWDVESGRCLRIFDGRTTTLPSASDQVQYTSAKVLLVGDPGVGKTGLSNRLALGKFEETEATDGAWATHWPLAHSKKPGAMDREIWLWDFAGQVDYRLVQQLFMDETAAAVLVFNPQHVNPFEGLGHWDRDLHKSTRKRFAKVLAGARIDRGGLIVSAASMEKFMEERGFHAQLHLTSAKTEEGCDKLREAIVKAIDWTGIPETTSPALYHRMKQEILSLRDSGLVLIRLAELKQRMELTLRGENFKLEELEAAVSLLANPGMIQRLDFGGFILLRPEVFSRYAAAVVRKVRKHPQEMGCIREDELLAGDLDYQDFKRLEREDEAVVLRALLETFISRAWCLRQPFESTALLTFPSYFRRERKEQPGHPNVLVKYRFDGPADDIYATLVVLLHHTKAFQSTELWKSAADFKTQTGAALGFTLAREAEGSSRLEVYFAPTVEQDSQVLFLRYVHDHLMQHAQNVVRLRHYECPNKKCRRPFTDVELIKEALGPGGGGKVFCPKCRKAIALRDMIEEKFDSPAVKEQVRELQLEGKAAIDNESRELMAVHHTGFIVAEAGQIYRGYTNSDHGIDGEIEFKNDLGSASGQRLYVQLKSGDSYLKKRKSDGAEIFQIKNPRWAECWQQQAYPVMLVIRASDGEIRWMDVSAYLKRESAGGKTVKQIVFDGERLDVMSVRRWREKVLR